VFSKLDGLTRFLGPLLPAPRFLECHCCCFRHIPHPADILPEQAALVEIVLEDANGKTVVGPHGVEVGIKEDGAEVPIHIPSIIPVIR